MTDFYNHPNRYVCQALEEMREQLKLLNSDSLDRYKNLTAMMIEEVQTLVSIMEAGLEDMQDIRKIKEERRKLKKKLKKLRAQVAKLEDDSEEEK